MYKTTEGQHHTPEAVYPELSRLEKTQVEKRSREFNINSEATLKKKFDSTPDLVKQVQDDPFSRDLPKIIGEEFSGIDKFKLLRASILSEKKGEFDKTIPINHTEKQKSQKSFELLDSTAEATLRLEQYIENNLDQIAAMDDILLWKTLCKEIFGTDSEKEITQKFSLTQRRGLKLAVANFIHDRESLKQYQAEITIDPQGFIYKYFNINVSPNISIEKLPIGFVVYLSDDKYDQLESTGMLGVKTENSAGKTIFHRDGLPTVLQGRIAFVKITDYNPSAKPMDLVRTHELNHIIYYNFHRRFSKKDYDDVQTSEAECRTIGDYFLVAKNLSEQMLEIAKDEIAAYFAGQDYDPLLRSLRFGSYIQQIDALADYARNNKMLSEDDTNKILTHLQQAKLDCQFEIKKIQLVAQRLHANPDIPEKKIVILLRITTPNRIKLLLNYVGLNPEDIDSLTKEKDRYDALDMQKQAKEFKEIYHRKNLNTTLNKAIFIETLRCKEHTPENILPALTSLVTELTKIMKEGEPIQLIRLHIENYVQLRNLFNSIKTELASRPLQDDTRHKLATCMENFVDLIKNRYQNARIARNQLGLFKRTFDFFQGKNQDDLSGKVKNYQDKVCEDILLIVKTILDEIETKSS